MRTNQTTSLSFFFFSCVCVCVCVCVLVTFFSPVQSSLPPFNKKRLMVGLILIRQLGWEGNEWGLNFLVYYLYSNYSPTTQLFYLTSPPSPPPIPPNSQFPIGLNYCKKKKKYLLACLTSN